MVDLRLRRRCRAALRDLVVPDPFSIQALCDAVASSRGRRLYLHPLEASDDQMPSGLWMATDVADHIFFEQQTSQFHQEHIICHEIGHMLCGHGSPLVDGPPDADEVRQVMARTSYTTAQEQEAEMVATLLLERTRKRARPATETERRVSGALGLGDG